MMQATAQQEQKLDRAEVDEVAEALVERAGVQGVDLVGAKGVAVADEAGAGERFGRGDDRQSGVGLAQGPPCPPRAPTEKQGASRRGSDR